LFGRQVYGRLSSDYETVTAGPQHDGVVDNVGIFGFPVSRQVITPRIRARVFDRVVGLRADI
jgi:hypothetical protein